MPTSIALQLQHWPHECLQHSSTVAAHLVHPLPLYYRTVYAPRVVMCAPAKRLRCMLARLPLRGRCVVCANFDGLVRLCVRGCVRGCVGACACVCVCVCVCVSFV